MTEHLAAKPRADNEYDPQQRGLEEHFVDEQREHLFSGDETDGSFLYKREHTATGASGGEKFARIAASPAYRQMVTTPELAVMDEQHDELASLFEKSSKNIVEAGPGGGDKIKYVAKLFDISDKEYVGVDVSPYCLGQAEETANKLGMHNTSILKDRSEAKIWRDNKGTILHLGGSIGNMREERIISLLKAMGAGGKRKVIVSHFLAPSGPEREEQIQQLKQIYASPENEDFVMSGFEALGLDRSKLEYTVEYEEGGDSFVSSGTELQRADKIKAGATLTEDMEVEINGKRLVKKAGEQIWAITSRRFTQEQFEAIAKQAGCKLKHTYSKESVGISVLQTPKKHTVSKFIRKHKKLLSAVLGTALLAGRGTKERTDYQRESHQQKMESAREENLYSTDVLDDGLVDTRLIAEKNEQFDEIVSKAKSILADRYNRGSLDNATGRVLLSLLKRRLVNMDRAEYSSLDGYQQGLTWEVEKFVQDYKTSILEAGYAVRPNAFLGDYQQAVKNTYESTGETKITRVVPTRTGMVISTNDETHATSYNHIGTYHGVSMDRDIASVNLDGQAYIVAEPSSPPSLISRDGDHWMHGGHTLENGRKVVADYLGGGYLHMLADKAADRLYELVDETDLNTKTWSPRLQEILMDYLVEGYDLSVFLKEHVRIDYLLHSFVFPQVDDTLDRGTKEHLVEDLQFVSSRSVELDLEGVYNPAFDLTEHVDQIINQLDGYREGEELLDDSQLAKLRSSIFGLLAASDHESIAKKFDTPQKIHLWIEDNKEFFKEFGYRIPSLENYTDT